MSDFLIISGSEKCGTTSLYHFLSDSGIFNVSIKKETNFFRSVDVEFQYQDYLSEFEIKNSSAPFLEASPGYLTDSLVSVKNIRKIFDPEDVLLVFCLRCPSERLWSSFNFHKSRLDISADLDFRTYVKLCFEYEESGKLDSRVNEWCLRALSAGKYYERLKPFFDEGFTRVMLIGSQDLKSSPKEVCESLIDRLGLKYSYAESYKFSSSNVGFLPKNRMLQRLALGINDKLEFFWNKNKWLKSKLMVVYRAINVQSGSRLREDYECVKDLLAEYYAEDIRSLASISESNRSMVSQWNGYG